jgi:hypothetical protein
LKFSILLPTRNRLELLEYAVGSVLLQDYADWEIVISDNASDQDVRGYVAGLGDPRIRYLRSEAMLPVTDNWNRALAEATGDYVIMLGDDDCLLLGCLSSAKALLEANGNPDLLYTEALQFAYPGVLPGRHTGFIQFGYCEFLRPPRERPFLLDKSVARRCVQEAFSFRIAYSYNMQHSIISRPAVERLRTRGAFFQSPYPDYYATNALFLAVERILVCPWPLVAIGISPKSFGFYYFNQREDEGVAFLKNIPDQDLVAQLKDVLLPGSDMNTSWLLAMETVERNFGQGSDLHVAHWRYRFMQFRALWSSLPKAEFTPLLRARGRPAEKFFWRWVMALDGTLGKLLPARVWTGILRRLFDGIHRSHPQFDTRQQDVPYANILELARSDMAGRWRPVEWAQQLQAT